MPRIAKELSALKVGKILTPGLHAVGGAPGLHLQVTPTGARSWIVRLSIGSHANTTGKLVQKRRDFGLGAFPQVSLSDARVKAREYRDKVLSGQDPRAERQAARTLAIAKRQAEMTFRKAAAAYIDSMRGRWKDPKAVERRESWLATYACPIIGDLQVADIELAHILAVLKQPADSKAPDGPTLWEGKTETAEKLTTVLRHTLDWAKAHGYRTAENPARIKGSIDRALPSPAKIKNVRHFPALPVERAAEFLADLQTRDSTSARALAVTILTALRTTEVTEAKWSEIDLDAALWVVPAARMKMGRAHRVPLSAPCLAILRHQKTLATSDWVFPGGKPGKPLSNGAMLELLKQMDYRDKHGERITTHGFRSAFRDYVAEFTDYAREVAEMSLAHAIGDKVEAAYRRGDLFDKRKRLMDDWATFCSGKSD